MKKHLKCLGLFLAICAGIAVFMAAGSVLVIFIVSLIGPYAVVALLILALLICLGLITHDYCKDWS